jgi:hypothetical protein
VEALVVASKEIGLAVNAGNTKYSYMVMPRDQNAGRSHNIKFIIVPLKGCSSADIWEEP